MGSLVGWSFSASDQPLVDLLLARLSERLILDRAGEMLHQEQHVVAAHHEVVTVRRPEDGCRPLRAARYPKCAWILPDVGERHHCGYSPGMARVDSAHEREVDGIVIGPV